MNNSNDLTRDKDVLGQDITPVFIKTEELIEKPEKIDHSKVYVLPSLKTRYFSMLIDVIIIVILALGITQLLEIIGTVPDWIRASLFFFIFVLYEPILITLGSTIGQMFLNIRVRSFNNPREKLQFHMALIRFLIKAILGWLSFITITFNINRRAIHDFVSGSIMISKSIENKKPNA
jgi:uncharacterized RDD family membrane protein YckC